MEEKKKRLGDLYPEMNNLLLYFLADGYLPIEEQDDLKTIQRFVSLFNTVTITTALKEGKEILTLDPFPWEWICDTANRYPFSGQDYDSKEGYFHWLGWILLTLEAEAKKAGKL